jgi:hypothetical protein
MTASRTDQAAGNTPLTVVAFYDPWMGDEYIGDFAIDLGDWCQEHADKIKADFGRYFTGFNGRHFERFSAMGSADPNRFAATDVLAVEALSVTVPPNSAAKLIDTEAEEFSALLDKIPADKDLWEMKPSDLEAGSPAWQLHFRLEDLHGVGPVTATKLMASKRPRLMPVIDTLVSELLQPPGGRFWVPMRNQLADPERRKKIADVVSCAPDGVTLLRRIDVAVWMHVKGSEQ